MSIISRYFKIISFALLVLVGIQLPGFVTAYGNNLAARLAESDIAIAPFQKTADQHFAGNLETLVEHYANNEDSVITDTGNGVQSIYQRNKLLKTALGSFQVDQLNAYKETFLHPIADVQKQVWSNYNYNVALDANAIIIGLSFALLLLIIIESLLWCIKFLVKPKRAIRA